MTFYEAKENPNFAALLIEGRIDEHLNRLKNEYTAILNTNRMLREENALLRGEHYKDDELAKLSNQLAEIRRDNDFILSGSAAKKRDEFVANHCDRCESYKKSGTYSYDFTKTPIADMVYIRCTCGEECYLETV